MLTQTLLLTLFQARRRRRGRKHKCHPLLIKSYDKKELPISPRVTWKPHHHKEMRRGVWKIGRRRRKFVHQDFSALGGALDGVVGRNGTATQDRKGKMKAMLTPVFVPHIKVGHCLK